jgi:hypothetical protein
MRQQISQQFAKESTCIYCTIVELSTSAHRMDRIIRRAGQTFQQLQENQTNINTFIALFKTEWRMENILISI